MQKLILIFCCAALINLSCQNRANQAVPVGIPGGVAKEALNTNSYTYVRLEIDGADQWVAIPRTDIKIGTTYYYSGGMEMNNFKSKELNRTFGSVLFLEGISEDKDQMATQQVASMKGEKAPEKHVNVNASINKLSVNIKPASGGITIAELYAKKELYSGKTVKISGQVAKFSPDIMDKNWVHLQDGTEANGKFDLTITTKAQAAVGDTITFEGKITLNKDFGHGYAYEVLMEDASKK